MFALLGLLFMIIKIAILATVYASLTLLFFYILSKSVKRKWLDRLMLKKFLFWFATGFVYTVAFFIYAFSFWGYSGLGDYFCIPVGNGFKVNSIDACTSSWYEPNKGEKYSRQADIVNFKIKDKKICAEFTGYNSQECQNCFIVFDTEEEKTYEFHSSEEYSAFAKKNNLPLQNEFRSFGDNYNDYWNTRRTLFLP